MSAVDEEASVGMNSRAEGERRQAGFVASWVVLGALTAVSVMPLITPGSYDESSVDAAMEHVVAIAQEPHPMGSPTIGEVREYLIAELAALGLQAELQLITAPDYFGTPGGTVEVVNVLARIRGSDSTGAVLLIAHHDTVPTTPGANDNSTAVGVLLETARVLLEGPDLRNDVILLFSDGEEPAPRFGTAAFVAGHPWANDVGFVVNLEAAGGSGPSTLAEIAGPGQWVIDGFAEAVDRPVAFSFLTEAVSWVGDLGTDFDSFSDEGIPGLNFAYLRDSTIYHTERDSLDSVSLDSVGHHSAIALGLARYFGDIDLTELPDSGDAVFFSVAGSSLVRYSASWSLPLATLAVVLFGVAMAVRRRDGELSAPAVLRGAGRMLFGMVVAVLTTTVVWMIIATNRPTLGVAEGYVYLGALTGITIVVWTVVRRRAERRSGRADWGGGVTFVWLALAVLTGVAAPGLSYLFVWPTLAASVVLLGKTLRPVDHHWCPVSVAAVGLPTLVLGVPIVDIIFQMSYPRPGNPGSEIVAVVGVALLLMYLGVALIGSIAAREASHAAD